jgi:putative membrane protein
MYKKKTMITLLAVSAVCLAVGTTRAQESDTRPAGATTQPGSTMTDAQFAKKAARGGMAEVKLGQLAEDKGESDTVKAFGKQMVDDHSKANDQLKSTASQENMTLPEAMSAKEQATYDSLSKLSGADFDKAYARDMVKDHREDIAEFKSESANGQDQAIKDFATQTLPTLQEHLKMARQMLHEVDPSSGNMGAKPAGNE